MKLFEFLAQINRNTSFPNLFIALRIYITITVTMASGKRNFLPDQDSLFNITDLYHYDLMHHSKISVHSSEWGPAKVLPIGPRTC